MSTETGIRRLHHAAGPGGSIAAWSVREGPAVAAGLMAPFVVAVALVPFRTDLSHTDSALVFVVVVVAIASLGSRAAGVLAALSAAAWFDYFLTRPYWTFGITDSSDLGTALLLLVVGLIVSHLAVRTRRLEAITDTDAAYIARMHATAVLAQSAGSADVVVAHVNGELTELLGLRDCRFESGTLLGQPPRLRRDGSLTYGGRRRDLDADGWPEGEIELRVYGNGRYQGRFMLTTGSGPVPPLLARLVAVTLAGETRAVLDAAGPAREG
ncbi:DUF4118 domain-containing protein [Streptomyces sp. NPDC093269]|uniref:DUF4118 domain-containing protein n=1 Tax=Streptomyces sp. NPDC093269 TaxID=3366038 RepID=UPI0038216B10